MKKERFIVFERPERTEDVVINIAHIVSISAISGELRIETTCPLYQQSGSRTETTPIWKFPGVRVQAVQEAIVRLYENDWVFSTVTEETWT